MFLYYSWLHFVITKQFPYNYMHTVFYHRECEFDWSIFSCIYLVGFMYSMNFKD